MSIIDSKRRLLYLLSISERVVREVRTGHIALRCKYLTYGNRYVDRIHSAGLLATLDPLELPSGIECNGCCRTFLAFVIDRKNFRTYSGNFGQTKALSVE